MGLYFVPTDLNPTAFSIQGIGVVPFSARGLTFEIKPIPNGKLVYDCFGVLHSTARPEFDLFEVTVSCEDHWPPAFVSLNKRDTYTITLDECFIEPINASGPKGTATTVRPAASGVIMLGANLRTIPAGSTTPTVWQRYRPTMQAKMVDWSFKPADWEGVTPWSITFRETR